MPVAGVSTAPGEGNGGFSSTGSSRCYVNARFRLSTRPELGGLIRYVTGGETRKDLPTSGSCRTCDILAARQDMGSVADALLSSGIVQK
jgi:hypothetical protein